MEAAKQTPRGYELTICARTNEVVKDFSNKRVEKGRKGFVPKYRKKTAGPQKVH